MRDLYILAFILALPALAVLGHDVYIAYNNTNLEVADRFYLSDLGWLWVNYSPDSYDWVVRSTDAVIWNSIVDPLLQKSALYVLGAPFAAFFIITVFMKIFGLGPFEGNGLSFSSLSVRKKGKFSFDDNNDKKRSKYKRK